MEALHLPFIVRPVGIDEAPWPAELPARTVIRLSKLKAHAAASGSANRKETIIAADTVVVCDGRLMGKPRDEQTAVAMLQQLRGRRHQVLTGLTVLDSAKGRMISRLSCTEVRMRDYREAEILDYVDRGEPFDKAGAYALQDAVFCPVAEIEGCYAGVVGLALCQLCEVLQGFGIRTGRGAVSACTEVIGRDCSLASRVRNGPSHLETVYDP